MEGHDPSAMSLANEPYCDVCRPFGQLLKQGYKCLDWVQIAPQDPFAVIPSKEQNCDLQRPLGLVLKLGSEYLDWVQMEGHDPSALSLANEPYCDLCRPFGQLLKKGYRCLDWPGADGATWPFYSDPIKGAKLWLAKALELIVEAELVTRLGANGAIGPFFSDCNKRFLFINFCSSPCKTLQAVRLCVHAHEKKHCCECKKHI